MPAWVDEYEIDGVIMRASEAPGKDEIIRHIDKMGVERVLTFANANDKNIVQICCNVHRQQR